MISILSDQPPIRKNENTKNPGYLVDNRPEWMTGRFSLAMFCSVCGNDQTQTNYEKLTESSQVHRPNGRFRIQENLHFFDLNIVDIEIRESELLGLTDEERKASFDMYCTTQDNQSFIIEVQLAQQEFFMERAILYSSLTIAHNAKRGPWDFHVQPVFFLGLLNFDLRHLEPEKANPDQFIHKFSLREDSTHEHMSRALRFAFLEIARFNKTQEECNSFEDKFLYMMKNLPTFVETPELWDDDYFHEMMQEAEYANMTEQEHWEYALAMKHKWDYQNTIDFAREEGREEGKIDVAKEMLADKVPVETIIKYTGLTEEQVRAL